MSYTSPVAVSHEWNRGRLQIETALQSLAECCYATGVSTGLAEGSYVPTFWASGVPEKCDYLVAVLTDDTVKWSFDDGVTWAIVFNPVPPTPIPSGLVAEFGGANADVPAGWLLCDGQAVNRTTYAVLFALIGTTYGIGDGSTTFNLPDMRAKVPVGVNDGTLPNGVDGAKTTRALAAVFGAETHTLVEAELAAHIHTTITGNERLSSGVTGGTFVRYNAGGVTGSKGSDAAHQNIHPSHVVNYIIKE